MLNYNGIFVVIYINFGGDNHAYQLRFSFNPLFDGFNSSPSNNKNDFCTHKPSRILLLEYNYDLNLLLSALGLLWLLMLLNFYFIFDWTKTNFHNDFENNFNLCFNYIHNAFLQ